MYQLFLGKQILSKKKKKKKKKKDKNIEKCLF